MLNEQFNIHNWTFYRSKLLTFLAGNQLYERSHVRVHRCGIKNVTLPVYSDIILTCSTDI